MASMSRTIVKDEGDGVDFALQGLGKQGGLEEGSKVEEAFARETLTRDQSISDAQSSHEMQGSWAMGARGLGRLVQNMPGDGRAGSVFGLTRLDRGFLITTDHPNAFLEERLRVFIEPQHWPCPMQELLWVLDMLPGPRNAQRECSN
jgi:hypothetical protein